MVMYFFDFSGKQSQALSAMSDYFMNLSNNTTDKALSFQLKNIAKNAESSLFELVSEDIENLPEELKSSIPNDFHVLFAARKAYIESGDDNELEIGALNAAYDWVIDVCIKIKQLD